MCAGVQPAQDLIANVPVNSGLEGETMVLDRDIGLVRQGRSAVIKLEALPFARYGEHRRRDHVGERRLITYLLDPVMKAADESGWEREAALCGGGGCWAAADGISPRCRGPKIEVMTRNKEL